MATIEKASDYKPARDTHALPPNPICDAYWVYNKKTVTEIDTDEEIIDFRRGLSDVQRNRVRPRKIISAAVIEEACQAFKAVADHTPETKPKPVEECTVYEHTDLPGLLIYNQLLPPETQLLLLSQIMHRGLAHPGHKTNINADYDVPYPPPQSTPDSPVPTFFASPLNSPHEMLQPKDTKSNNKQLNMIQYLSKKLRWLTLGDQYDWPTRRYSGKDTTSFPSDVANLVASLFPDLNSQSGVVLLYSPKDFMPVHRDVSEQCERGLASFSLGCDGLFVIARDTNEGELEQGKPIVIRVRSGDVLQLEGQARWAWHAMPKVIAGTCPDYMRDWPAGSEASIGYSKGAFSRWKGYMSSKRLNLSCREVWARE